jgi:two-component system LytT family response regulator
VKLRALIVDDEALARRRIRRLRAGDSGIAIAGECADGASALTAIDQLRPDLVFLDVQMPELDGFEVLQRLEGADLPAIVFVTAYDRYALRAFDVHAIDYLLKPFTPERFRTALSRVRHRLGRKDGQDGLAALARELRARPRPLARIAVRAKGRILLIETGRIDWIEAADNYVRLHAGGAEYLLRETLAALEQQLDPDRFVRIHRSTIVQLDRVRELHPATHGDFDVVLRDGTRLTLSRTCRDRLERALGRAL